MSRNQQNILLAFISTLLVLIISECFLYLFVYKEINFQAIYLAQLQQSPMKLSDDYKNKIYKGDSASMHSPHPYYGFVNNVDKYTDNSIFQIDSLFANERLKLMTVNNQQKNKNEYYIGILGGSFASEFYYMIIDSGIFVSGLKKNPFFKNKKIILVNLTQTSSKQPQTFTISSRFLDLLDMSINIDGYNEIMNDFNYPSFPLEYPPFYKFLFPSNENYLKQLSQLYLLHNAKKEWAKRGFESKILSKSNIYYLLWKIINGNLDEKISDIMTNISSTKGSDFYKGNKWNDTQILEKLSYIWKYYTELQYNLSKSKNVKTYFFVQPNQHLVNSKIFNENQKTRVLDKNKDTWYKVRTGYDFLFKRLKEMQKESIPIRDLTQIFSKESRNIYRDACCHVLPLGNKIVNDNIVAIISKDFSASKTK